MTSPISPSIWHHLYLSHDVTYISLFLTSPISLFLWRHLCLPLYDVTSVSLFMTSPISHSLWRHPYLPLYIVTYISLFMTSHISSSLWRHLYLTRCSELWRHCAPVHIVQCTRHLSIVQFVSRSSFHSSAPVPASFICLSLWYINEVFLPLSIIRHYALAYWRLCCLNYSIINDKNMAILKVRNKKYKVQK